MVSVFVIRLRGTGNPFVECFDLPFQPNVFPALLRVVPIGSESGFRRVPVVEFSGQLRLGFHHRPEIENGFRRGLLGVSRFLPASPPAGQGVRPRFHFSPADHPALA